MKQPTPVCMVLSPVPPGHTPTAIAGRSYVTPGSRQRVCLERQAPVGLTTSREGATLDQRTSWRLSQRFNGGVAVVVVTAVGREDSRGGGGVLLSYKCIAVYCCLLLFVVVVGPLAWSIPLRGREADKEELSMLLPLCLL